MPQSENQADDQTKKHEELVRKIAERVWELWREELRKERERYGLKRSSY